MSIGSTIEVQNAQRAVRVVLSELQRFSEHALPLVRAAATKPSEFLEMDLITVILVSDRRIAALHRKFMNLDGPTDVITFQHGDIFVSAETARRNAVHFRNSTLDEIKLYIVHGLLHLAGFDDKAPAETRRMVTKQGRILAALQSASAKGKPGRPV